jgi:hypothetical protein
VATPFFLGMIRRVVGFVLGVTLLDCAATVLFGHGVVNAPLATLALAALVYVLIRLLVVAEVGYFDFESAFGAYLIRETFPGRLNRYLLGASYLLAALLLGVVMRQLEAHARLGQFWLVLLISLPVGSLGLMISTTGLRLLAPRGETLLTWSFLRPVLYLRSFSADAGLTDAQDDNPLWALLGSPRLETAERSLAAAVGDVGPVVAIGRPRERVPPLGAARMYVGDEWQEVVSRLVEASRLVLLRAGTSEGFLWELQYLVEHCDHRKVVVFIPKNYRGKRYRRFRDFAQGVFPRGLPPAVQDAPFIGFDSVWRPRLLGAEGTGLVGLARRILSGSQAPGLRSALGPRLRALGLGPASLPLQFREWVLILYLGFILFRLAS